MHVDSFWLKLFSKTDTNVYITQLITQNVNITYISWLINTTIRPLWNKRLLPMILTNTRINTFSEATTLQRKYQHLPARTCINTLRPRQNGLHFPDDIFKCNFLDAKIYILIRISLKFVPNDPISNIPTQVQIMAWRRSGDKPLSEPMMAWITDTYMRHSATMS